MRLFLLLLISSVLVGCATTERKAKNWAYDNKAKLAEWCADCFPVKPVEVIKGRVDTIVNEVLKVDSVRVTVDCPDGTTVDCPPSKTVVRVVETHSTDTVKIRDTALETVLENKYKNALVDNEKLSDKLADEIESKKQYRKYFFGLLALVAVYGLLKFKRIL